MGKIIDLKSIIDAGGYVDANNSSNKIEDLRIFTSDSGNKSLYTDGSNMHPSGGGASIVMNNETGDITITVPEKWQNDERVKRFTDNTNIKYISGNYKNNKDATYQDPFDETKQIKADEWVKQMDKALKSTINVLNAHAPIVADTIQMYGGNDAKNKAIQKLTPEDIIVMTMNFDKDNSWVPIPKYMLMGYPELEKMLTFRKDGDYAFVQKADFLNNLYNIRDGKITEANAYGIATAPKKVLSNIEDLDAADIASTIAFGNFIKSVDPKRSDWDQFLRTGDARATGFNSGFYDRWVETSDFIVNLVSLSMITGNKIETRDFWNGFVGGLAAGGTRPGEYIGDGNFDATEYLKKSIDIYGATDSKYKSNALIGYQIASKVGEAADILVQMFVLGDISNAAKYSIYKKGASKVAEQMVNAANGSAGTGVATAAEGASANSADWMKFTNAANSGASKSSMYNAFFSQTLSEAYSMYSKTVAGAEVMLKSMTPGQLASIVNSAARVATMAEYADTAISVLGSLVISAVVSDKDLAIKVISGQGTGDDVKMLILNSAFLTMKGYAFAALANASPTLKSKIYEKYPKFGEAVDNFNQAASQKFMKLDQALAHPWNKFMKWYLNRKAAKYRAMNKVVPNRTVAAMEAVKENILIEEAKAYGANLSRESGSNGVKIINDAFREKFGTDLITTDASAELTLDQKKAMLAEAGIIFPEKELSQSEYQAWEADYVKFRNAQTAWGSIDDNISKVVKSWANPDIEPVISGQIKAVNNADANLLKAEERAGLLNKIEEKTNKRLSKKEKESSGVYSYHSKEASVYAVRSYELGIIRNEAILKGEDPNEYKPYIEALARAVEASKNIPNDVRDIIDNEYLPALRELEHNVVDKLVDDEVFPRAYVEDMRASGKYGKDGKSWLRLVARKEAPKGVYNPFSKLVKQDNTIQLTSFKVLDDDDITWVGNGLNELITEYAMATSEKNFLDSGIKVTGDRVDVVIPGYKTGAIRKIEAYHSDLKSAINQGVKSFVESSSGTVAIGKKRARQQSEFYKEVTITGGIASMDIGTLRTVLQENGVPLSTDITDQASLEKFYDESNDYVKRLIDQAIGSRGTNFTEDVITPANMFEEHKFDRLVEDRANVRREIELKKRAVEDLQKDLYSGGDAYAKTVKLKDNIDPRYVDSTAEEEIWNANQAELERIWSTYSNEKYGENGVEKWIKDTPYGQDAFDFMRSIGENGSSEAYGKIREKYSKELIPSAENFVNTEIFDVVNVGENQMSPEYVARETARLNSEIANLEKVAEHYDNMLLSENYWPDFWKKASKNVKEVIKKQLKNTSLQTGYGIKGQILERLNAQVPGFNILDWSLLYREHANGLVKGGLYSGMDNVDVQAYIMDIDDLTKMLGKKYIPTYTDNVDILNENFSKNVSNYTNSYNKNAVIPAEIVKGKNGKLVLELSSGDSRVNTMDWSAYLAKLKKDGVKKVPIVIARSNSRKNPGSISKFIDKQNVNAKNITSELSDAFSAQDKIPFFHGQSSAHDNNWYGNIGYNDTAVIPTGEDAYTDNNGIGDAYWLAPNSQYTDSYGDVKISGYIPKKYFMSDKERVEELEKASKRLTELTEKGIELAKKKVKLKDPEEKILVDLNTFNKVTPEALEKAGLVKIEKGKNLFKDVAGNLYKLKRTETTKVNGVNVKKAAFEPTGEREELNIGIYEELGPSLLSKKERAEYRLLEKINPNKKWGGDISYRALAEYAKKPVIDVSIAQQSIGSVAATGTAFFYYKGVSPKFDEELGKQLEAQANAFPKEYDVNSEENIEKFIPKDMTVEDIFRKIAGDTADYDLKKWYSYIEKTKDDVFADRWFGMFIDGMTFPYQKKYPNTVRIIRSLWSNSGAGNNDLSKIKFGNKLPHIDGYDGVQVFLGFLREMGLPAPQSQTVPEENIAAWNAIDPRSDNIPDTPVFKAPKGDVSYADFKASMDASGLEARAELFRAIDDQRYTNFTEMQGRDTDKFNALLEKIDRANAANNDSVRGSVPVRTAAVEFSKTVRELDNTIVLANNLSYLRKTIAAKGSLQEFADNNGISVTGNGKNIKKDVKEALWDKLLNGEKIPEIPGLHIKNIEKEVANFKASSYETPNPKNLDELEKSVKTLSDELTDLIRNHGDKEKIHELEYELSLAKVNLEMAENNTSFEAKNEDYPGWAVSARYDGNMQLLDKLDESNPKFSSEGTLRDYYRDYKGKEVVVVEMPAGSYIGEIQDFGKDWGEDSPFRDSKKIDKYLGMFRDGKLSPLPIIGFDENGKVIKQEGRHRTEAADIFYNEQGKFEEKIPVIIEYPKGSRPKILDKYKDVTDKFVIKKNTATEGNIKMSVSPEEISKELLEDLQKRFYEALDKTKLFQEPSGPNIHKYEADEKMLDKDLDEAINDMINRIGMSPRANLALEGLSEFYGEKLTPTRREFYILGSLLADKNAKDLDELLSSVADKIVKELVPDNSLVIPGNIKSVKDTIKKIIKDKFEGRFAIARASLATMGENVDSPTVTELLEKHMKELGIATDDPLVVKTTDKNGEITYIRVSPTIAGIYNERATYTPMSTPMKVLSDLALLKKISMVDLNPTSFMKQAFSDPAMAFVTIGVIPGTMQALNSELKAEFGDILKYMPTFDPTRYSNIQKIAERDGISMEEALLRNINARASVEIPFSLLNSELLRQNNTAKYGNKTSLQMMRKHWSQRINDGLRTVSDKLGFLQNKRETYPRTEAGVKARLDAIREGYSLEQAEEFGIYAINNATTNFRQKHAVFNGLRSTVPFLTSGISGAKSFWQMFELDPVGVSARIFNGFIVPILYFIGEIMSDEELRKKYEALAESEKDNHIAIAVGGEIILIPVGEEIGQYTNIVTHLVEKMYNANKYDFYNLMLNDVVNLLPAGDLTGFTDPEMWQPISEQAPSFLEVLSNGTSKMFASTMPPVLQTGYMLLTGRDLYTGKRINTGYTTIDDEGNKEIMTYSTSQFAKWLGKVVGGDAKVIEKVVTGLSGTVTGKVLDVITSAVQFISSGGKEGSLTTAVDKALEDVSKPFVARGYDSLEKRFNARVSELYAKKKSIENDDGYKSYNKEISKDANAETRQKKIAKRNDMFHEFQNDVKTLVEGYRNAGGTLDKWKLATVTSLLTFEDAVRADRTFMHLNTEYTNAYKQAMQTLYDMGITDPDGPSALGYVYTDKQGNPQVVIWNPAQMQIIQNAMKEQGNIHAAHIKAIVDDGTENSLYNQYKQLVADEQPYFDKFHSTGKLSDAEWDKIDDLRKEFNEKLAIGLTNYMNSYGAANILSNDEVINYFRKIVQVPSSYETVKGRYISSGNGKVDKEGAFIESYLKQIFGVANYGK